MKRLLCLVSLFSACSGGLVAQTASFNFSAGSKPVTGWTNVVGDPSQNMITGSSGNISISSVAPANWSSYEGASSYDGGGMSNGTFFPAGVMANNWYQYSNLGYYNAAMPQFIISGLTVDTVYTLKMTGSNG